MKHCSGAIHYGGMIAHPSRRCNTTRERGHPAGTDETSRIKSAAVRRHYNKRRDLDRQLPVLWADWRQRIAGCAYLRSVSWVV
jgi:hypothetical protein